MGARGSWRFHLCTFATVNMRMTCYQAEFWQKSVFCQFLLCRSSVPCQTRWSMRRHAVVCYQASKNIIKTYDCQAGARHFFFSFPSPFLCFSLFQSCDDTFCCILKCGKTDWHKRVKKNTLDKSNLFLPAIKVISTLLHQWLELMLLYKPHCARPIIPSTRWHFYFPLRLHFWRGLIRIIPRLCLNTH